MSRSLLLPGLLAAVLTGVARAAAPEPLSAPLTAVTRAYDTHQLLASVDVPTDVRKGRALWVQRCAFCHDGVGQPTYRTMGPWLGAETVQVLGPDALRAIIGVGTERMPGFQYTLKPQQVAQVIEYLKTVPSSQKPTAEQLAKKSSGAAAQVTGE